MEGRVAFAPYLTRFLGRTSSVRGVELWGSLFPFVKSKLILTKERQI